MLGIRANSQLGSGPRAGPPESSAGGAPEAANPAQCDPVPAQHDPGASTSTAAVGAAHADADAIVLTSAPAPGRASVGAVAPGAEPTTDYSILVGETAVLMSRGASLLIAKNSVFHGTRNTDGAFALIDLGGNTFE